MKQKHNKKRIFIIVAAVVVFFSAAAGAYLAVKNYRDRNSQPYTYFDCVEDFGTTTYNPPRCITDEGEIYTEFKLKSLSYEDCVGAGEKSIDNNHACVGADGKYIENYPATVNSYNECIQAYNRWNIASVYAPEECIDQYGRIRIAGGPGRSVNDYVACVKSGGIDRTGGKPNHCYYDGVVYYQVLKPSHKYLNPPYELKTYVDCVQHLGEKITSNSSCKSPLGLIFYYNGDPPIRNYKECLPIQGARLDINLPGPDKCVGPDGTIYTESE